MKDRSIADEPLFVNPPVLHFIFESALYVDNNPLTTLPNEVVEAGSEAVLSYLQQPVANSPESKSS